jgi:hypothetical protein
MDPCVYSLFQFTRSRVSTKHIAEFSPGDPGYEDYVRLWTRILRTGEVPAQTEFDLSEVIGLTGWADPDDYDQPDRFRQYRRFTSAVAIALVHAGNDCESVRVANYLTRDLIVDCDPCDSEHLLRVRNVFLPTRDILAATNQEPEYPFFTFGALILAQMANDHEEAVGHAAKLVDEEAAVRTNESLVLFREDSRFLLGLTNYNQLHADWIRLASRLSNPLQDMNTPLIIDAMTEAAQ